MNTQNKATPIWHKGACHCGSITFEVNAPSDVVLTLCNCSICEMTGYQHLIVRDADFRLINGADNLTTYTFNTHTAQHTFCKTCGVKSFYVPRSHPDGVSVNFRCLDKNKVGTVSATNFDGQNWEANIEALRDE